MLEANYWIKTLTQFEVLEMKKVLEHRLWKDFREWIYSNNFIKKITIQLPAKLKAIMFDNLGI